jgi:hypothetical protein
MRSGPPGAAARESLSTPPAGEGEGEGEAISFPIGEPVKGVRQL